MSDEGVYLIKIHDRPYGFKIVAIVAMDERDARDRCIILEDCQFSDPTRPHYAEIRDSCECDPGSIAVFEYEE